MWCVEHKTLYNTYGICGVIKDQGVNMILTWDGAGRKVGGPSQKHSSGTYLSVPDFFSLGDKGHWATQRGCHQVMGVRALSYYLQGQTDHVVKLWDPMVLPAAPAGVNIGPRVTSASPSGSEYWVHWESIGYIGRENMRGTPCPARLCHRSPWVDGGHDITRFLQELLVATSLFGWNKTITLIKYVGNV